MSEIVSVQRLCQSYLALPASRARWLNAIVAGNPARHIRRPSSCLQQRLDLGRANLRRLIARRRTPSRGQHRVQKAVRPSSTARKCQTVDPLPGSASDDGPRRLRIVHCVSWPTGQQCGHERRFVRDLLERLFAAYEGRNSLDAIEHITTSAARTWPGSPHPAPALSCSSDWRGNASTTCRHRSHPFDHRPASSASCSTVG